MGGENSAFVHLVIHIVKTYNYAPLGNNYRREYMGIPQGTPFSLLLMNFFLNQLDNHFLSFDILVKGFDGMERLHKIRYARYKDVILLGFQRKTQLHHTAGAKVKTREILTKVCINLKLEFAWEEIGLPSIFRFSGDRPDKLNVLGLVVSLTDKGLVRVSYPMEEWKRLLTLDKILNRMARRNKHITMACFLSTIHDSIEGFLKYAVYLFINKNRVMMLSTFFMNLVTDRATEFVRRTGCSDSGEPGKTISQVKREYFAKTLPDSFMRAFDVSECIKSRTFVDRESYFLKILRRWENGR